jgi:hypothetical protein
MVYSSGLYGKRGKKEKNDARGLKVTVETGPISSHLLVEDFITNSWEGATGSAGGVEQRTVSTTVLLSPCTG